jgi:hypothetical protein
VSECVCVRKRERDRKEREREREREMRRKEYQKLVFPMKFEVNTVPA